MARMKYDLTKKDAEELAKAAMATHAGPSHTLNLDWLTAQLRERNYHAPSRRVRELLRHWDQLEYHGLVYLCCQHFLFELLERRELLGSIRNSLASLLELGNEDDDEDDDE